MHNSCNVKTQCYVVITVMFWEANDLGIRRRAPRPSVPRLFVMWRSHRCYDCLQIRRVSNSESEYGRRPGSLSRCRAPHDMQVVGPQSLGLSAVLKSPSTKLEHSQPYNRRPDIGVMCNACCRLYNSVPTRVRENCDQNASLADRGAPRGGGCCLAASPQPQRLKFQKTYFADIMSKVLRDLPFSRNQPRKSADWYIRALKN
jgi:hypothetical protein